MVKYKFKGIEYEILSEDAHRIFSDFKYCEEIGDYKTIQNRITNGVMYGWLKTKQNERVQ